MSQTYIKRYLYNFSEIILVLVFCTLIIVDRHETGVKQSLHYWETIYLQMLQTTVNLYDSNKFDQETDWFYFASLSEFL